VHAGAANNVKAMIAWVRAEDIERDGPKKHLAGIHGLLVAPGFGERGIEGKIQAIRYVRENRIPFFGICLGLQCAVIEFARNVCGLPHANSTEFKETDQNVIDMMIEQKKVTAYGGTMRLGAYPCAIAKGTLAHRAYRTEHVSERHRHRYEVNNAFRDALREHGMVISGVCPDNDLVEIIELPDHPWFVAGQFHPELRSRATHPHPLFKDFVRAAMDYKEKQQD
jgi:CTP synthase